MRAQPTAACRLWSALLDKKFKHACFKKNEHLCAHAVKSQRRYTSRPETLTESLKKAIPLSGQQPSLALFFNRLAVPNVVNPLEAGNDFFIVRDHNDGRLRLLRHGIEDAHD